MHKGVQVDERQEYGTVNDVIESPRDFNPDEPPTIPVTSIIVRNMIWC